MSNVGVCVQVYFPIWQKIKIKYLREKIPAMHFKTLKHKNYIIIIKLWNVHIVCVFVCMYVRTHPLRKSSAWKFNSTISSAVPIMKIITHFWVSLKRSVFEFKWKWPHSLPFVVVSRTHWQPIYVCRCIPTQKRIGENNAIKIYASTKLC